MTNVIVNEDVADHKKSFMVKIEWKDQWVYCATMPEAVQQAELWAKEHPQNRVFIYKMMTELKHKDYING